MNAKLLCALSLALLSSMSSGAGETVVRPQGEFAKIDVRLANETIRTLAKGTPAEQQRAIQSIKATPENYAPPVLYALSETLFARGEKDDAAFWFYAGQLRARFDANRCNDASARQAVAVLNQRYGEPINRHTFQDIPKLEALIPRVVQWDRATPHKYDHRWINLHGMEAMQTGLGEKPSPKALSAPAGEWPKIADKTREDYLTGFRQAMAHVKSQKK